MQRTPRFWLGIALMSMAVIAVAAAPGLAQRGGRRGPGGIGEEYGSQGDSSGGFRGRGGLRGMGGQRGQFPGGGGPPGMFPGGGGPPGMFPGGGGPQGDFRRQGGPQGDFRGRGGPFSGEGRGPGRGSRGPFGGSDGGERLERFLRAMDANGDGRIEENEVDGRQRNFLEMMARQAGLELRLPMPVNRLRDAINRVRQAEAGNSSASSAEAGNKKAAEEPLVPGFGLDLDLSPVLSFGQRPDSNATGKTRSSAVVAVARSGSRSSSSSSSSSPRGGNGEDRTRRFAEAMMRQADHNGNGRLEPDEWNERWGDFREADRNHDGAITSDELAQRLGGFARRGPGGNRGGPNRWAGAADPAGGEGSASGSGSTAAQPKPYRLPTPTELLPPGLPDWFAQKDANADGQVAMAEFESPRSWTPAAVAEFTRFDLNNDGIITATECLTALNPSGTGGQLASAERPRQAPGTSSGGPAPGPASDARSFARPPGPGQGPAMMTGPGRRQQPDRFRGMAGQRARGSQNRGENSSPPAGGSGTNEAWAGFE